MYKILSNVSKGTAFLHVHLKELHRCFFFVTLRPFLHIWISCRPSVHKAPDTFWRHQVETAEFVTT